MNFWSRKNPDIHVYVHQEPNEQTILLLNSILSKLNLIMAKQDQMNELLTRLDAATNELASDLAALRAEIADTVSSESLATLDANIKTLEEMGKDPANPIPEEPEEETPVEETPQ